MRVRGARLAAVTELGRLIDVCHIQYAHLRRYLDRLDEHADAIVDALAAIARSTPINPSACSASRTSTRAKRATRRWFAEWFENRHGIVVAELDHLPL